MVLEVIFMDTLGERIRELRLARKMTLSILAKRVDVAVPSIAAYENGSRTPSVDVLVRIARVFNVTLDNLMGLSTADYIDVSELTDTQRATVQNVIMGFSKLNDILIETKKVHTKEDLEDYMTSNPEGFWKILPNGDRLFIGIK